MRMILVTIWVVLTLLVIDMKATNKWVANLYGQQLEVKKQLFDCYEEVQQLVEIDTNGPACTVARQSAHDWVLKVINPPWYVKFTMKYVYRKRLGDE